MTNDKKIGTEINIANTKNEIIYILYKKKTGHYGKRLLFKSHQNNIDEVAKKHNLPNNHKITKTLIPQMIATDKNHVTYGQGNSFHPYC